MVKPSAEPTCGYCGRPALESGACKAHEDLLALEPDRLAAQVDAIGEVEQETEQLPRERDDLGRFRSSRLH